MQPNSPTPFLSATSIFMFERVCPFPSKVPVKASAVLGVSASFSASDFGSKMPTGFTVSPPKSISAVSMYDAERSSYIFAKSCPAPHCRSHCRTQSLHLPSCRFPPSYASITRRPIHKSRTALSFCRRAFLPRNRTSAGIRFLPAPPRP